jgi:hypothetical protein
VGRDIARNTFSVSWSSLDDQAAILRQFAQAGKYNNGKRSKAHYA